MTSIALITTYLMHRTLLSLQNRSSYHNAISSTLGFSRTWCLPSASPCSSAVFVKAGMTTTEFPVSLDLSRTSHSNKNELRCDMIRRPVSEAVRSTLCRCSSAASLSFSDFSQGSNVLESAWLTARSSKRRFCVPEMFLLERGYIRCAVSTLQ